MNFLQRRRNKILAERRERLELGRKLAGLTDPTFLDRATRPEPVIVKSRPTVVLPPAVSRLHEYNKGSKVQ